MLKEKSCGTIILKDKEVLLLKQNNSNFSFPKGHVEEGETEIETALRETKEETNLDVLIDESKRFVTNYIIDEKIAKEVVYFLARPLSENIIIQESEIEEYSWIDIDDVIDYMYYEESKIFWLEVLEQIKKQIT